MRADKALHEAKSLGRNRVVAASSLSMPAQPETLNRSGHGPHPTPG